MSRDIRAADGGVFSRGTYLGRIDDNKVYDRDNGYVGTYREEDGAFRVPEGWFGERTGCVVLENGDIYDGSGILTHGAYLGHVGGDGTVKGVGGKTIAKVDPPKPSRGNKGETRSGLSSGTRQAGGGQGACAPAGEPFFLPIFLVALAVLIVVFIVIPTVWTNLGSIGDYKDSWQLIPLFAVIVIAFAVTTGKSLKGSDEQRREAKFLDILSQLKDAYSLGYLVQMGIYTVVYFITGELSIGLFFLMAFGFLIVDLGICIPVSLVQALGLYVAGKAATYE